MSVVMVTVCGWQGYQTLDELKTSNQLNRQQLIGLAHYDEFLERMPRAEAGEIEQKVSIINSLYTVAYYQCNL